MRELSRRGFLNQLSLTAAAGLLPSTAAPGRKTWRAAIIGATGQGDYGHSLDVAFSGVEGVEVVAVADPHSEGRARAAERAGAKRQYAEYREMLARERPELVVIAPRWSEQHAEMAMTALDAGAHILTEKPFTPTLAQADRVLEAAARHRRKVAVAHQMRLAPNVVHLHHAVAAGLIGDLRQIRSWGKQDARAGGEDMIVLGTHLFDLMRLFAGDATACSAQVFRQGRPINQADIVAATERIGPVAGDEIEAQYTFANGITGSFTSRGRLRETLGPWAIELVGSKGMVRILMDIDPTILRRGRRGATPGVIEEWTPLPGDPGVQPADDQKGFGPANRRVVSDWLEAIAGDREPRCSGSNAMKALEFVMAAFEAGLTDQRVAMPMAKRAHPLE